MLRKLLLASLVSSLIFFTLPIYNIARAAEPEPTTLIINSIDAYNDVINDNDQLHLVTFEIDWSSGNYTATEAFIFRFISNGIEIATTTPYSYYNEGKSQGVIGFFFDANDPNLPTWESANLSIQLIGNPLIDWAVDPSTFETSSSAWNSWNTGTLTAARVRRIALDLEDVWSIDLIEPVSGVNKLTSYGEDYFTNSIPNLQEIAPNLFTSRVTSPSFPTDNHSSTAGDEAMDRWTATGNGTFDVTEAAVYFGTSRNWLMSGLWIVASITLLVLMTYGTGQIKGTGYTSAVTLKPALYLFGFMMIIGSFMSFMVMQVGLFCGIVGGLIIIFTLFWRGSP